MAGVAPRGKAEITNVSEYSDYYAVQTEQPSELVDQLNDLGFECVVFDDWLFDEQLPAWVPIATDESAEALTRFGPVIHLRVNEDRHGWQLIVYDYDGEGFYTFFDEGFDDEHETPDGFLPVPPRAPDDEDARRLSATFGVDWERLAPTLAPGRLADFSAVTRVPWIDMLDQTLIAAARPEESAPALRASDLD